MQKRVRLVGKHPKARSKLDVIGTTYWLITEERDAVGYSNKPGPWYKVRPDLSRDAREYERWINQSDDTDYEIHFQQGD